MAARVAEVAGMELGCEPGHDRPDRQLVGARVGEPRAAADPAAVDDEARVGQPHVIHTRTVARRPGRRANPPRDERAGLECRTSQRRRRAAVLRPMQPVYSPPEPRRTDRSNASTLARREREALQLVERHPRDRGGGVAETMGVGIKRAWPNLNSLEFAYLRLERDR